MSAGNREIVEKVNAAFAENSTEGFLSFCADDIEWTMVGDKTFKGKESIRQWMATMDLEAPTFAVENVIADGDCAVSNGDMTMKDKEGKAVPYAFCDVYRFRDGKIVELRSFVIKTADKYETTTGS